MRRSLAVLAVLLTASLVYADVWVVKPKPSATVWAVKPKPVKEEKSCQCSSQCVCGCNEGKPCQCGKAQAAPAYQPAVGECSTGR